jgi:hypothetical protein
MGGKESTSLRVILNLIHHLGASMVRRIIQLLQELCDWSWERQYWDQKGNAAHS